MTRFLLLGLAALLPLAAQTSSLQGTVTDGQNAAVADAIVNLVNEETTTPRKTIASPLGSYSFAQVPPGAYRLEVAMPGFRVFKAQLRLQINTPAALNVQLEVGQVTESVSVSAEASAVNTQNATMGSPFTEMQVRQLPRAVAEAETDRPHAGTTALGCGATGAVAVQPGRDARPAVWLGAAVKNIAGLGEVSASGLPGEVGILVLAVPPASRSADAGLRKGDVVLRLDGKPTDALRDLERLSADSPAFGTVRIAIWCGQREMTLEAEAPVR